jgi:hypothetical protein
MRFRLRTLLILVAVGPMVGWGLWVSFAAFQKRRSIENSIKITAGQGAAIGLRAEDSD